MKRLWVLIVNVILMISMLVFVVVYSMVEGKNVTQTQIEHFENTTVTMEHVTENYLEGEQRICDVWAEYIDNKHLTMDEAVQFIHDSHVLAGASAHIVYFDTLEGLSTKPNTSRPADKQYKVSYQSNGVLVKNDKGEIPWIHEIGSSINVTHAYTNEINGDKSIAFCNIITLDDGGTSRKAVLLRLLPVSELKAKWVFPKEEYKSAELSVIDPSGNYIIKGNNFQAESFFQFYISYNHSLDSTAREELFNKITAETGTFKMFTDDKSTKECVVSYTPFDGTGDWILVSMIPTQDLIVNTQNWLLISFVSIGLFVLFVFDLAVMSYFNKRLRVTAKEAELASRAKTDFLSTMSHDIRTPMNAVIGLTTIAEKNLSNQELVKENLRKINLASNHLLTLINDILDISKVESGKLNFIPQSFSIVETVENLMNLSQPMIKEKNIDFNFHISRMDKEYLYADQLRLNQIYINLLSNAIKYTEPGGKVSVDMKEEESEKEGCIKLTYQVADTGIGMSPEYMKHLYQPFSRQIDSRVNSIQGTGLGLAITKQMVDLMQGTIDCQSEQGVGTTFTVTLDIPVAEHQRAEMKLEEMDVLIIDDDEVLLETAVDTLQSLGLVAEQAGSGLEGIGMIKHREQSGKNYDIVIIDLKMPDIDGIETIRRIRSEVKSTVPILLISAYSWSDVEDEAKQAGVNGFLSKPLFRSTLYDKISQILGTEVKSSEPQDDYADLAGMNILVAEDNDINWEIISALLSMYGITSERAENGRICVDKIKQSTKGSYSLVFMDIQMPEMNGLDATRTIRKMKGHWASSIPIVAMTADAFAENVAECLDAGMNGHIAKPIDIKLVIKMIRKIKEESK